MQSNDTYLKIQHIIADVLAIDLDKIEPNLSLIKDLGAESIDFLDLTFRLEREFQIKLPRGDIEKKVRGSLTEEEFEQKGVITPAGMAVLKKVLPETPENYFKPNLKVVEIPTLFTPMTFYHFVTEAINQK